MELLVAEPRHRCGLVRQTGGDQVGVVSALIDGHHDALGFDLDLQADHRGECIHVERVIGGA